jgi:hypothetical protein
VIASACIESRFAAARRIFPERRTAAAAMTLARAQGRASPLGFARPRFRRPIMEGELSPAPQRSDSQSGSSPKSGVRLSSRVQAESCPLAAPVSRGIQEPLRRWTPQRASYPAVKQAAQAADLPRAEPIDANRLLASLVLHAVRPRRSGADAERGCSLRDPKFGLVSSATRDVCSLFTLQSERTVTRPQAGSPDPVPPSIETLFTELARRRLRRLAAGEKC